MTDMEIALVALGNVRRELFDYAQENDDIGTIVLREGCYFLPQVATPEDIVLDRLKTILNNERLVSAMRRIERRCNFSVCNSHS